MKLSRFLILVAAGFWGGLSLSGCTSSSRSPEPKHITAARQELEKRWGHSDMSVEDARFVDGRWEVNVWRLPKTPGGMATVEVSEKGEVLRVISGM